MSLLIAETLDPSSQNSIVTGLDEDSIFSENYGLLVFTNQNNYLESEDGRKLQIEGAELSGLDEVKVYKGQEIEIHLKRENGVFPFEKLQNYLNQNPFVF